MRCPTSWVDPKPSAQYLARVSRERRGRPRRSFRESGAIPELPRSGHEERNPSQPLGIRVSPETRRTGKDRGVGGTPRPAPRSPKTSSRSAPGRNPSAVASPDSKGIPASAGEGEARALRAPRLRRLHSGRRRGAPLAEATSRARNPRRNRDAERRPESNGSPPQTSRGESP